MKEINEEKRANHFELFPGNELAEVIINKIVRDARIELSFNKALARINTIIAGTSRAKMQQIRKRVENLKTTKETEKHKSTLRVISFLSQVLAILNTAIAETYTNAKQKAELIKKIQRLGNSDFIKKNLKTQYGIKFVQFGKFNIPESACDFILTIADMAITDDNITYKELHNTINEISDYFHIVGTINQYKIDSTSQEHTNYWNEEKENQDDVLGIVVNKRFIPYSAKAELNQLAINCLSEITSNKSFQQALNTIVDKHVRINCFLNRYRLNPNNPAHLQYWSNQVSLAFLGGGKAFTIQSSGASYRLPERIHLIMSFIKTVDEKYEWTGIRSFDSFVERIHTIKADADISNPFISFFNLRKPATSQFYRADVYTIKNNINNIVEQKLLMIPSSSDASTSSACTSLLQKLDNSGDYLENIEAGNTDAIAESWDSTSDTDDELEDNFGIIPGYKR